MKNQEIRAKVYEQFEEAVKTVFEVEEVTECPVSFPPEVSMGDFAIACFPLAKELRTSPQKIAEELASYIQNNKGDLVKKADSLKGYLNIKIRESEMFGEVCSRAFEQDKKFGFTFDQEGEKVMVEYLSPNTNKPLHIGHLRNGSLGMAISNLLSATGQEVVKANLVNDRGVHICKSMLAWQKWGEGKTPESEGMKGDHFVGDWYVKFSQEAEKNPELKEEAYELLRKWEEGDPETVKLWEKMNGWVYEGFDKTYKDFGMEFDVFLYESLTYKLGKDIIKQGLKKGVFHKDGKGNTVFDLPAEKFGTEKEGQTKKVTVLRPDGTSLYMTQDIATAILKFEKYGLNRSIYVVGSEQEHHFECLFEILKALGYSWAEECYHLSYGMVYLPEGKMKSREGKVVDADDLISEVYNLAHEEIYKREGKEIAEEELKDRAFKIAMGAIKFYLLSVKPKQDINFNPKDSISFDGVTGPYCQYAYARIKSIIKKAESELGEIDFSKADFSLLGNKEELVLIHSLMDFPREVRAAVNELNPSRLTTYVYYLAKFFHQFYNKHRVVNKEEEVLSQTRLVLTYSVLIAIRNGLNLLNIEVLEKM